MPKTRRSQAYQPTGLQATVIESQCGKLFAWNKADTLMGVAPAFRSDDLLIWCRFVLSIPSTELTYYIVGNHYDQDTIFTPVEHWWHAPGATKALVAQDLPTNTVVSVEMRLPEGGLPEWQMNHLQRAIWTVAADWPRSTIFCDHTEIRALLR